MAEQSYLNANIDRLRSKFIRGPNGIFKGIFVCADDGGEDRAQIGTPAHRCGLLLKYAANEERMISGTKKWARIIKQRAKACQISQTKGVRYQNSHIPYENLN